MNLIAMDHRPTNFGVEYRWQEGSLPPPYHYEYRICLLSSRQGEVTLIPDYPAPTVPVWPETFPIAGAELDAFYFLVVSEGAFQTNWQSIANPPVGGSSESMKLTVSGCLVEIPAYLKPELQSKASIIYKQWKELMPEKIWNKLMRKRQHYIHRYERQTNKKRWFLPW